MTEWAGKVAAVGKKAKPAAGKNERNYMQMTSEKNDAQNSRPIMAGSNITNQLESKP